MSAVIAGHSFVGIQGLCTCGKTWADISWVTEENIGQVGLAHTGAINAAEVTQIENERERFWRALREVCAP